MHSAQVDSIVLESTSSIVHTIGQDDFDRLDSYRPHLKRLAYAKLHKSLRVYASASDIVQDTFASAFRLMLALDRREIGNLRAWLSMILQFKIYKLQQLFAADKRNPSRVEQIDRIERGISRPRADDDPARHVDGDDAFAWAMSELPEDQRIVVELRLLHRMSMREAAQSLGIEEDCASQRYYRGINFLRERIDPIEFRRKDADSSA